MSAGIQRIDIRDINNLAHFRAVEDLQKEVWGCSDREILPSITLIPLLDIGGVLVGAFAGNELVGFALGFPGFEAGGPIIHSDMLAVKHEYRFLGLGYRLKLAQRERALAQGVNRITWTFDPLQSRNAHLNFAKLGVVANRYKSNYYGETSSFLHSNGTDRLWVTWKLQSARVRQRLDNVPAHHPPHLAELPRLVSVGQNNAPMSEEYAAAESCVIEIPAEIDTLVRSEPEKAKFWRESTRTAFTAAINGGLVVKEFFRMKREQRAIGLYLLERN